MYIEHKYYKYNLIIHSLGINTWALPEIYKDVFLLQSYMQFGLFICTAQYFKARVKGTSQEKIFF